MKIRKFFCKSHKHRHNVEKTQLQRGINVSIKIEAPILVQKGFVDRSIDVDVMFRKLSSNFDEAWINSERTLFHF